MDRKVSIWFVMSIKWETFPVRGLGGEGLGFLQNSLLNHCSTEAATDSVNNDG